MTSSLLMQPSETVTVLERDGTTFYIVGTAHVSEKSVAEVREVIGEVEPDTVCVELCAARYEALKNHDTWRNLDLFKVIREGKTLFLLSHLAMAAYQRHMGKKLGVRPGAELLAAAELGEQRGAKVELVDRDIKVTLKRTWGNLGLWTKMNLIAALIAPGTSKDSKDTRDAKGKPAFDPKPVDDIEVDDVERLKEQANLSEMLTEFARVLPQVKTPLIDERDQYLMSGIEQAAARNGSRKVVAVVGAAHVPGMKKLFGTPVDRAALETIPPPSWLWTAAKWLIPILLVAALFFGWSQQDKYKFHELVLAWLLPTSAGAALFTALGGARLLSIVTAFLVAPIAAIHPLLGTGMVVGVVEAWLRKPTVADCENTYDDIRSLRGFYRNPVLRTLLIAMLSGLGTALGTWIGVGYVIALL
jgi:pheromone shutdown-related protein TraB